jgi:hypothetical protein
MGEHAVEAAWAVAVVLVLCCGVDEMRFGHQIKIKI